MFSHRLPIDLSENRLTLALAHTTDYIDLTVSNPTAVGISYPPDLLNALADPAGLRYHPAPLGMPQARHAVAEFYRTRGVDIGSERILLTASTSEAYSYLFKLLCDPGDEVLVPQPSYPLFAHLAELDSVKLRPYPLRHLDGWFLDLEEVRRALTPKTRAILVVNPNNPTGSFLKREELDALDGLAAEHGIALISDEVFADYVRTGAPTAPRTLIGPRAALTFSLSGLSKTIGLPQLKLGWIAMSGPPREIAGARIRLEHIADTYLSVGTPIQLALPDLLDNGALLQPRISARVAENHARLRSAVAAVAAIELYESEGGWYDILRIPAIMSEEEWAIALLMRDRVLVHPGFFFDFDGRGAAHLVLSLLPEAESFAEGTARLSARVVAEL